MALLTGRQLKKIFDHYRPFDGEGRVLPPERRVTLLAANANLPLEVQARAFALAAGLGRQSPILVQVSYNGLRMAGSDPSAFRVAGDPRREEPSALLEGAMIARELVARYAEHYGAELVAFSLDHFRVPKFSAPGEEPPRGGGARTGSGPAEGSRPDYGDPPGYGSILEYRLARERLVHALEAMAPVFGPETEEAERNLESYVAYLCSNAYRRFRLDFLSVVAEICPAWGMIDTEHLPPALNFAVTRDIAGAVREELGNQDMIIEAEFGATGTSGRPLDYRPLRGEELRGFARRVAAFLKYTGAEGISYPIGMAHAARLGERHQPDEERLVEVQGTILRECGRYVPFAQHGGTGAAALARGLVAKNNVNTRFLVEMAQVLADHVEEHREGIRLGDKGACGVGVYARMVERVARVAVEKLEEAGSYQRGPEVKELLGLK